MFKAKKTINGELLVVQRSLLKINLETFSRNKQQIVGEIWHTNQHQRRQKIFWNEVQFF